MLEHVTQNDVVEATRDLLGDRTAALEHPGDRCDFVARHVELCGELGRAAHVGDLAATHVGEHRREVECAQLETLIAFEVHEIAQDREPRAAIILARDGLLRRRRGRL